MVNANKRWRSCFKLVSAILIGFLAKNTRIAIWRDKMADFFNEIMQDDDSNNEFEGFSSDEDENDENGNDREGEIRINDNFMRN